MNLLITQVLFLFLPVVLVVLMYGIMLAIILQKRGRAGWFRCSSSGISLTSLLSYLPSIFVITWDVYISYDVVLSIVGIFRGLGMISTKFIGAPDGRATVYCVMYTICLNTFT